MAPISHTGKVTCHLPPWRLNPALWKLLTSNTPWGSSGCSKALQAIWWDRPVDTCFRNRSYDPNPCISSYLEKHSAPSWWHQVLLTSNKHFVKWMLNGLEPPLHQTLYIDSPPLTLWSSLSELSEMRPPSCSPHFAPNKNLTHNLFFWSTEPLILQKIINIYSEVV